MFLGIDELYGTAKCYFGRSKAAERVSTAEIIFQASIASSYEDAVVGLDFSDHADSAKYVFREERSFSSYEKRGWFYKISDGSTPDEWNKVNHETGEHKHETIRAVTFKPVYWSEVLKQFNNGKAAIVLGNKSMNTRWVLGEILPMIGGEQLVTILKTNQNSYNLKNHLGKFDESELSSVWKKNGKKVFVSHCDSYKKEAQSLAKVIEASGDYCCFVAHESIEPGKEWPKELDKALSTMDGMICFLTKEYYNRAWTNQESGIAVGRGVPVIHYSHDSTNPVGFGAQIQAVKSNPEKLCELLKAELPSI